MKKKILLYSLLLILSVGAVVIVYSLLFPEMPQKVVKEAQEVIVVSPPEEVKKEEPKPAETAIVLIEEVKKEEPKPAETAIALNSVPKGATSIEIEVTAGDLSSPVIQRIKIPEHSGPFSIPLLIPAGVNRNFSIRVFDARDALLSKKDLMANILSGKPNSISIALPEVLAKKRDISPPSFNGLSRAAADNPSTVRLKWQAAKDNTTPVEKIHYLIYMTSEGGQSDMSKPAYSVKGRTSIEGTGLGDGGKD